MTRGRTGPRPLDDRKWQVVSIDPAALSGIVVADVIPGVAGPFKVRSGKGWPRHLFLQTRSVARGREVETARQILGAVGSRKRGERVVLVIEAQYMGNNVQTAMKIVEARARWTIAFELVAAELELDLEVVVAQAASWIAGWLGLGSAHGRDAIKIASNLSAEHAATMLGLDGFVIVDDEADALNMLLWWLDQHHLVGLPRKWARASER